MRNPESGMPPVENIPVPPPLGHEKPKQPEPITGSVLNGPAAGWREVGQQESDAREGETLEQMLDRKFAAGDEAKAAAQEAERKTSDEAMRYLEERAKNPEAGRPSEKDFQALLDFLGEDGLWKWHHLGMPALEAAAQGNIDPDLLDGPDFHGWEKEDFAKLVKIIKATVGVND